MIGKEEVKMFNSYFGKNLIAGSLLIIITILINPTAYAASNECAKPNVNISTLTTAPDPVGWFRITGTISHNGDPLCGLVLANGQFMFTCGDPLPKGNFDLTVPPDSQGQITLFGFSSGLTPFQQTIGAGSSLAAAGDCTTPWVTVKTVTNMPNGYFKITGTIDFNRDPLCGLVLANGQFMFTCGDPLPKGDFDLTVPPDSQGNITLFGFSSGLAPFQRTFSPSSPFRLAAGTWSGENVCFNVSPDGSKLTRESSLCTINGIPPGYVFRDGTINNPVSIMLFQGGKISDRDMLEFSVANIPIIQNSFDVGWVKGIFNTPTMASGIGVTNDKFINWDASNSRDIKATPGMWSSNSADGDVCFHVSSDSSKLVVGDCPFRYGGYDVVIKCSFAIGNFMCFPIELQIVNKFFWSTPELTGKFTSNVSASGIYYGSDRPISWSARAGYWK
jgi:hypothetical protein